MVKVRAVSHRGDCPEGATLLDCARQLGVDLVNLCGGTGSCGHCIVQLMEGYVSEPVPGEGVGSVEKSALVGRISHPSRSLLVW
jgi:ferredoxin